MKLVGLCSIAVVLGSMTCLAQIPGAMFHNRRSPPRDPGQHELPS